MEFSNLFLYIFHLDVDAKDEASGWWQGRLRGAKGIFPGSKFIHFDSNIFFN